MVLGVVCSVHCRCCVWYKRDNSYTRFGFLRPQGHAGVVRVLLAREEIDVDEECNGLSPLDKAKQQGHSEIVALLHEFLCNAPKY